MSTNLDAKTAKTPRRQEVIGVGHRSDVSRVPRAKEDLALLASWRLGDLARKHSQSITRRCFYILVIIPAVDQREARRRHVDLGVDAALLALALLDEPPL